MSRPQKTSSHKRKSPESNSLNQILVNAERVVLNVIKSKEELGILKSNIKRATNLAENVVKKILVSLQSKELIKVVVNIQNKREHFVAAEFEPSKELTGGAWYVEGNLDNEFIRVLKNVCLKNIRGQKVATEDGVLDFFKQNNVTNGECTSQHIAEILRSMVLDNEIVEVKSTGLAEYHSIPIGTVYYKCAPGGGPGQGPKAGAMASVPCGVCPQISKCSPDGIISPITCVYFTKWLDLDF